MRDEITPTASGQRREQSPMASCYYTWQQKWRTQPSSAAIQLGRMKPTQQSLPQQYRDSSSVHLTRSSNTKSRDFWLAIQCIHITSFFYAYTTPYAYTQLGHTYTQVGYTSTHVGHTYTQLGYTYTVHILMHTPNHHCTHAHMHTHSYAYTPHDTILTFPYLQS